MSDVTSKAIVYHLQEPWVELTWGTFSNQKVVSLVRDLWNDRRHTKVADVPLPSELIATEERLSYAFKVTNTLASDWWKNKTLTTYFVADGCRSTSVGDVIEIEGQLYVVCPVGFEEIDDCRFPLVVPDLTKSATPKSRVNDYWVVVDKLRDAIEALKAAHVLDEFDTEAQWLAKAQYGEQLGWLTKVEGELIQMYNILGEIEARENK